MGDSNYIHDCKRVLQDPLWALSAIVINTDSLYLCQPDRCKDTGLASYSKL